MVGGVSEGNGSLVWLYVELVGFGLGDGLGFVYCVDFWY